MIFQGVEKKPRYYHRNVRQKSPGMLSLRFLTSEYGREITCDEFAHFGENETLYDAGQSREQTQVFS